MQKPPVWITFKYISFTQKTQETVKFDKQRLNQFSRISFFHFELTPKELSTDQMKVAIVEERVVLLRVHRCQAPFHKSDYVR